MDRHLPKFQRVLLQRNAPVTIWFGRNEYHFECKRDINRPNCTVVQRKPEKKKKISRFEPLKNPRPWCITVKDLKLSKVAVGCPT